jgi:hypothetical protein
MLGDEEQRAAQHEANTRTRRLLQARCTPAPA